MLDEPEKWAALDKTGMTQLIRDYPGQLMEAASLPLPDLGKLMDLDIRKVLFLGMGGSGASGEYAVALLDEAGTAVGRVGHDYDPPAWVDEETLVVATSFSGGTEETLAALAACKDAAAGWIAIASGGALADVAVKEGAPLVRVPAGQHPRAQFGYLTVPLLRILGALGLLDEDALEESLSTAIDLVMHVREAYAPEVPTEENGAKQLAESLAGMLVLILADTPFAPVAERIRCQLNENGKALAFTRILPEANHNDTVAWTRDLDCHHWTSLWVGPFDRNPSIDVRARFVRDLLEDRGVAVHEIDIEMEDDLARRLAVTYLGDWLSFYLGLANGVDPGDVSVIPRLKERAEATGMADETKRALGLDGG